MSPSMENLAFYVAVGTCLVLVLAYRVIGTFTAEPKPRHRRTPLWRRIVIHARRPRGRQ